MANNIKGITIEIGGDFSKFDKGIKDAESKSKSLTSELKQINNQLKFNPQSAVLLQQKFDVLSQKVQATRDKLKLLEEAQDQVKAQFERGEIDEGQYRAFQREVELTRSQLEKFEKDTEDAKKDLDNLGNEADKTGDDFTEMGTDAQNSAKKVGDGFNTTAINMSAVMNVVSQVGNVIKSAIQGAINLGKKIAGIINDYYDTVDEINTNSKKYGISTDTYQKWKYAAEIIDVSAETMGSSLGKMVKQMSKAPEKFEELGVSIYDASGKYRDSEDVFYDVIDALGEIGNETEQEIAANELFGKSFQELEPLIGETSDTLKQLGEDAEDRGVIMTPEELETMQKAKDALDEVRAQLATALAPLIEELSPYIEQIAKWIGDKLADPKVQELLGKVGEAMGQILEGVAQLIEDAIDSGELERFIDWLIEELPNIAQFIVDIVGSIKDVLKAIKSVIDFFDRQGKKLDQFTQDLAKGWAGVATSADSSIGTMEGDWFRMLSTNWDKFSSWGEDVKSWFLELPNKIYTFIQSIPEKIRSVFETAKTKISEWFNSILNWFKDLPNKIWNFIKSIPQKIAQAFSGKATVSANGVIGYHGSYAEGGVFKKSSFINVGEDGPEVVLPLDKIGQVLGAVGGGGSIIVNAPVQVVKELNDAELNRVGGRITDIVGRQFAKRTGGTL